MAALSADRIRRAAYPGQGYRANLFCDQQDTYYKGAIVVFQTNGALKVASNVNGEKVAGIVMETTVVDTSAGGFIPVLCRSRVWFEETNVGAVKSGDFFIASNDNDLSAAAANKANVGRCVGIDVDSNQILIDMDWIV